MNRLIIAIMALVWGSALIAASGTLPAGYLGGNQINASIIMIGVNSSYSNTTSPQAIYSAESYLATRLGQTYYNNYVSYYGAASYSNASYAYFTYIVPFANGSSTMVESDIQFPSNRLLGITVSLSGTKVNGYIGPSKPYFVNVSYPEAINLSDQYGILKGNGSIEGVFNTSNITRNSTYLVAWAVLGNAPLKSGIYQGIYIDAQSGKAMGEYDYNPLLGNASKSYPYAYGAIGNFSMFYMQAVNQSNNSTTSSSTDSQYILPLTILAFAMLGVFLYLSRRQQ